MVEKFIVPITTFLREIGLKSGGLVTILGIGGIIALEWYEKLTIISSVVIGIITIAFIISRTIKTKTPIGGEKE